MILRRHALTEAEWAGRNASGRVSSPNTMSAPPKTPSTPANQSRENIDGASEEVAH
ncbi:MAG: hypothetical protein ACYC2G_01005 [Gemmatimonadaceae bacterium]